jgi:formylglycine-generating enzyme required for sulfatase activity
MQHEPHTIPLPLDPPQRLMPVPGGSFRMGSDTAQDPWAQNNETPHEVHLSPYYIGEHPVTQALWTAVMGENPSDNKGGGQLPVENVSWYDAAVFCNRLSMEASLEPCYHIGKAVYGRTSSGWVLPNEGDVRCDFEAKGYRLPTEAEWECAARGGPDAILPGLLYAGSDELAQVGWYGQNSGNRTQEAGLLLPNALGLYDMSGNVWEWCHDWYASDYYKKSPRNNPHGPAEGAYRVQRGGSDFHGAHSCRSACRLNNRPVSRSGYIGFRLALSLQL